MIKKLPDFPGYQIYSDGRIFSQKSARFLRPSETTDGYLRTHLIDRNGIRKTISIHRLVAQAFIHNPNNYSCINHKDENKHNNDYSNLEWCDRQYNNNYGQHKKVLFGQPKQIAMCSSKNHEEVIKSFNCINDAEKFLNKPNAHCNIIAVLKGRRQIAYGYFWKYL